MRVIAGKYRSRALRSLRGAALRPTSDRLRETLFNILGETVKDSVFVDVYAGTGAVGIEALSRGAREAIFIEKHATAAALIRKNLQSLGIEPGVVRLAPSSKPVRGSAGAPRAEVLPVDAVRGLELLASRRLHAHFFFLDPPYAERTEYERALEFLDGSALLTPGGCIILEHQKRFELPEQLEQLERVRVVEQGDAALSFYRLALAA